MSALYHASANLDSVIFKDSNAEEWDTAIVHVFQNNTSGDDFSLTVTDGIDSVSISGSCYNATKQYKSYTITGKRPSRNNRLVFTLTGQNASASGHYAIILQVDLYNSHRLPSILFANFGVGGSGTTNWIGTSSMGNNYDVPVNMGSVAYFIMLGINDVISGNTPAAYIANMKTLINALPSTVDKILLPPGVTNNPTYNALLAQYLALYPQLASETGAIDWSDLWDVWTAMNLPKVLSGLHQTSRGYKAIADTVWRKLMGG